MFTSEDIQELSRIFGITPVAVEKFKVKDGFVQLGDKVWWASEDGPEHVIVTYNELVNIRQYPEIYSIAEPLFIEEVKIIYTGGYKD